MATVDTSETKKEEKPLEGEFKEAGDSALAVIPPKEVVLSSQDAGEFIERAVKQADALKAIIDRKNLAVSIGGGTKKHVLIDGWQTLMALNGVMPYTVSVTRVRDGETKKLTVYVVTEIRRVADGFVLTRVESSCSQDEKRWSSADEYAVVSMAQTRGVGKGCRQLFGWVMALAGYDATPAEEMPGQSNSTPAVPQADARPKTPMDDETKALLQARIKELKAAANGGDAAAAMKWGGFIEWMTKVGSYDALWADDSYTYAAKGKLGIESMPPKARPVSPFDPDEVARATGEGHLIPPAVKRKDSAQDARMVEAVAPGFTGSASDLREAEAKVKWNTDDQQLVRETIKRVQGFATKDKMPRAIAVLDRFKAFMDKNNFGWTSQNGRASIWDHPQVKDDVFEILELTPAPAPPLAGFDPDEVPV